MRVKLSDIAKKLRVSKTAVSMALRNSPGISRSRCEQIQQTAKKMGYVPDPFLSGLAAFRRGREPARNHGVLAWVNHWEQPRHLRQFKEFNAYWQGSCQAATGLGYRVDEVRWPMDCSPNRFERILLARGIEGVLIPPHHQLLNWGDFEWNKFAVIRFGMSVQNPDSNQVTSDVFRASVMAVNKMHEYGYRRIGVTINEEFNRRLGGNFLSGYYYAQTLLKLKPALPPLLTILKLQETDETLAQQKIALQNWLRRHKPEAVLTADMAIPNMIRELGYRIPRDIAVAGTSVLDIPVDAGIDQRANAIGRIAVEMLVKQINLSERGEPPDPCRILVESRWIDGNSLPVR